MANATDIRIKFDDGSVSVASGEAAKKVWEWFMGCESLANVHNMDYQGPYLTKTQEGIQSPEGSGMGNFFFFADNERFGEYDTFEEAIEAKRRLKANGMSGFSGVYSMDCQDVDEIE